MAVLLNERMSSQTHISKGMRHVRLCKRTQGTEQLVANIQPAIDGLKVKAIEISEQKELRDSAQDDVFYNDALLDDAIRNVSDEAKLYDRKNPGRPVYQVLFPGGKYSDIVRAPFAKELNLAEQIAQRIGNLGAEHELNSLLIPLTTAIANVRTSITNLDAEETKVKTAIADEESVKAELRKQYEFNYHDAAKMFGKKYADRLFPKTAAKSKVKEEAVLSTEQSE
ncbi:hypothetical protein [Labilibaculum manganireducens]|uniref:hypothetical protein n=1 Tax=Labilibaculum manganireducens TaxID=1940525 RepID=UPI0029F4D21F|nr:hypothetical protein [Labilibaculum manganireducens]